MSDPNSNAAAQDPNRVIFLNPSEGRTSQAVSRAVQELIKANLDPKVYVVSALKKGPIITVSFTDKDAPRGVRGGVPGGRPGYAVELEEASHRVVKTYWIR